MEMVVTIAVFVFIFVVMGVMTGLMGIAAMSLSFVLGAGTGFMVFGAMDFIMRRVRRRVVAAWKAQQEEMINDCI